ncbi:hypothetical protein MASR1M45_25500 [Candidatus Kapaibacterium sp.]
MNLLIKIFAISLLFILGSCDELLNPSSDYVIEKSVVATSDEQIFEAGNDFQDCFPTHVAN